MVEDIVAKSGFVFKGFKSSRRNLPKKAKIGDAYSTYVYVRRPRQKKLALMVWSGDGWNSIYIEVELK